MTPDGSRVYVANFNSASVSVILTATNTVLTTVAVGGNPQAFGIFIRPAPSLPVPTLSGWSLLALGVALIGLSALRLRGAGS